MISRMKKIGDDVITYDEENGRILKVGSNEVKYGYQTNEDIIVKVGEQTVYYFQDRFHAIGSEIARYNEDGTVKSFGSRAVEYEKIALSAVKTMPQKTANTNFPFWANAVMSAAKKSDQNEVTAERRLSNTYK